MLRKKEKIQGDQTSLTDNSKIKEEPELSTFRQADTKPAAAKGQKAPVFFLLRSEEKRDFRSVLINQAVIMAPMPSCRPERSRHPVTQRPGPRGQSPSQNSTPGRTPPG